MRKVVEGAHLVPMGQVNAILLDAGPELVLVDAGFPGKASVVLDAIRALGRSPGELRHLVLTHAHPDHIGSAAAIVRETGARTYLHGADVAIAESGGPFRPMTRAPGLVEGAIFRLVWRPDGRTKPFRVDTELVDGETLPLAGGLRVIHVPGHCAGQVALLWQGRMLIAADACSHVLGLGDPIGFEDADEGRRSQRRLAGLAFETACFGHGRPIVSGAAARFRRAFG